MIVSTADGSYGVKGFVTDAMKGLDYSYFYCCGPEAMLKAVWKTAKTSGQLSFEERMGCGFGACMGCSCYPVVLRPAFTLGGTGGGFANNEKELVDIASNAFKLSPVHQVLYIGPSKTRI